jgi:hypothetical protein
MNIAAAYPPNKLTKAHQSLMQIKSWGASANGRENERLSRKI